MGVSFDLTREPWIPCVMVDGRYKQLGIEEALVRAHEVREISDESPLVTIALHRLLLAVLHRVFGPKDEDEWAEMWRARQFDEARVCSYLNEWRQRFDLFHPQRPFFQIPDPGDKISKTSANRLGLAVASGHNPTLFSHFCDDPAPAFAPAQVARWLVALQAFAPGGFVTPDAGSSDRSSVAAPLHKGAVVLPLGSCLFETLMLSLVPYDPVAGRPYEGQSEDDRPAWEQEEPAKKRERDPVGYLDYLTWQSRRIFLEPTRVDGDVVVQHAVLADGLRFKNFDPHTREQMVAYQRKKNAYQVVSLDRDRAFWRDSLALFEGLKDDPEQQRYIRPPVMDFVDRLVYELGVIPEEKPLSVFVGGLCAMQGKPMRIYFWRAERMSLPLRYLRDQELVHNLANGLEKAEQAAGALKGQLRNIAREICCKEPTEKGKGQAKGAGDERARPAAAMSREMEKKLEQRTNAFPSLPVYWDRLGREFPAFFVDLATTDDQDERLREWTETVRSTALDALERTLRILPESHEMLRLGAQVRRELRGRLVTILGRREG